MKRIFLAVLAMSAVGAMVLAGAGSAAKAGSGATAAPRAAANHVGVGVVRQVGFRNYAGPNCPGAGWNCTTATRVLQVATAGGTNVGVCTGTNPGPSGPNQSCVISQSGASNTARCTESSSDPTSTQSCLITQTGAQNYAFVNQSISQSDTSTQSGKQFAQVTQGNTTSPTTGVNQLQLNQTTNQSVKTGTTQAQVAGQSAIVSQTAGSSGTNSSSSTQSQGQKEYAKSTSQFQNSSSAGSPVPSTTIDDCDTVNPPARPNICADIQQHADAGTNENHLRQSVSQDMNSSGTALQWQGSSEGGLDGHVHQDSNAHSLNDVNQSKNQSETVPKGPGSFQIQFDPVSCCGFASQFGGSGNTESITQSASLSASGPGASQSSDLIGTSNTDGTCSVTQKASVNVDSANNSETLTPCPSLTLETHCSSSSEGGDCTAEAPIVGQPDSAVTIGVKNITAGDPSYSPSTAASPGDLLEFQVVYSNTGGASATNVSGTAPIPQFLGSPTVNLNCSTGSCGVNFVSGLPASVSWNTGTVAPNTSTTVTFNYVAGFCPAYTELPTVTTAEEGTVPVTPAAGAVTTTDPNGCIG